MNSPNEIHEDALHAGNAGNPSQTGHAGVPASTTGRASRWVWLVVIAALVGGGVVYVRARNKKDAAVAAAAASAAADRAVPVTVGTVEQKDLPIWLEGLGNATPLYTVTVKTLVDGRLDRMFFKEGDQVKQGQVIAQVDPRPFQIALLNAEAALARDTAQSKEATVNLQRYKTLGTQKLIAQQQVDDQAALEGQYAGTTKGDEAAIESAKLNLDYAAIKSPIDGVTGVRLVDPGNIVHAADQTGIVVITQLDPMALLFTLPEDDLPRVSAEMMNGPVQVEAYARDGVQQLATGKLQLIDNQVNETTATIRLKAVCPNPKHALWPNEFVKARLLLETRKGAITAPATAVQRGPKGTFIYVMKDDNTVEQRPVEVDIIQGDLAVLKSGVKPGDKVVTDGQNQLKPGAKVAARAPEPSGAPSGSASGTPRPPPNESPSATPTSKTHSGSAP